MIVVLLRGRSILPSRPYFDLGRLGYFVNIVSVCWSLLVITMYLVPMYVPVTIATVDYMNWSCAIVGATVLFPGAWWLARARHRYIKEENSVLSDNVVVINDVAMAGNEALGWKDRPQ